MNELAQKTSRELVDDLVNLDRLRLQTARNIDAYKAELQARGISIMDDRNKQYIRFFGSGNGSVSVMDKKSLEILNPDRLRLCVSEGVYKKNVTETTETKYKCGTQFEAMLKALFTEDYTFEMDMEEMMDQLHIPPDTKQRKLLLKRLKGDYEKDRKTLNSVFDVDEDWDTELWYIHRIKNGELIRIFLSDDMLDAAMAELKKCIIVGSSIALKVDYEEE